MKRRPDKHTYYRLLSAFLSAAVFICHGCSMFSSGISSESVEAAELPTMQSIVDEGSTNENQYAIQQNPVAGLYGAYTAGTSDGLCRLELMLVQANTLDALDALISIYEHNAQLSCVMVSCGRLTSASADANSGFSDTLIGAANGSGSITYASSGAAILSFVYDDGRTLTGKLITSILFFRITDADGAVLLDAYITQGNGEWLSCVEENGLRSVLCCGDEARFVCFPLTESDFSVAEYARKLTWERLLEGHLDAQMLTSAQ